VVPIEHGFDIYARGGLGYTWLVACPGHDMPPPGPSGYSGRSLEYGFGARWLARARTLDHRHHVVGGFLLDVNRQLVRLQADGKKDLRGSLDMVTFGLILGGEY
jgi:hypothetical protein